MDTQKIIDTILSKYLKYKNFTITEDENDIGYFVKLENRKKPTRYIQVYENYDKSIDFTVYITDGSKDTKKEHCRTFTAIHGAVGINLFEYLQII